MQSGLGVEAKAFAVSPLVSALKGEDYDEAIRLDPQLALAYNNRGLTYGFD